MANRYCGNCGNELAQDVQFCPSCGRPAHETAQVSTSEARVDVPPPPHGQDTETGTHQGVQRRRHPVLIGCLGIIGILIFLVILGSIIGGGDNTANNNNEASGGNNGKKAQKAKNSGQGGQVEAQKVKSSGKGQRSGLASKPKPTPKPEEPGFSDGTYQVGADIKPGTYRTREGSPGCYYARLAGFSNEMNDILANGNTDSPAVVTIKPTDTGFESQGCGKWTQDLSAITESKTSFDDGAYIVGKDIEPGTYKNSGSSGCYYARLSDFTGDMNSIIANGTTDTPTVVTIKPTDTGFEAQGCGKWTKIG